MLLGFMVAMETSLTSGFETSVIMGVLLSGGSTSSTALVKLSACSFLRAKPGTTIGLLLLALATLAGAGLSREPGTLLGPWLGIVSTFAA